METIFAETDYESIRGLVREALDRRALLERRDDADEPFLVAASDIFEGHAGFHVFTLSEPESGPIGFTMTVPGDDEGTLDIGPTYITDRYRDLGLGKGLVAHVIEWARQRGVCRLGTATWGANVRARHVFESVGFTFTGEELDARVDGDSTVTYELILAHPTGGEWPAQPTPSVS